MTLEEKRLEIYWLLGKLAETSECLDKQVACVLTDDDYNIISYGVNTIVNCNKNCHDKEHRICNVVHAEVMAKIRLPESYRHNKDLVAHVTLFPCQPCQRALEKHCSKIISYTEDHKGQVFENIVFEKDLKAELTKHNGKAKQLSVAQGELAELITAISDYFYRPEKLIPAEELLDEIVDAELMIDLVKRILWEENREAYNILREVRVKKYAALLAKLQDGGL